MQIVRLGRIHGIFVNNQEIAVVPVRSPLQKATAALAMLRLHCALLRSRRARGMSFFRSLGHPRLKQIALVLFSPRGLAVWRRPEVKKNAAAMGRRAFRRSTFWLLFSGGVVWVPSARWFSWAI